jgi:iron(III) transport system ATP-binding protein
MAPLWHRPAERTLRAFDEPLSHLDADRRQRLRVQIAALTPETGATAVYITHDQSDAFALADKLGVLDHRELIQLAGPEEIFRRPAAPSSRFTGVAAELGGQLARRESGYALIHVDDIAIRTRTIGTINTGDAACAGPTPSPPSTPADTSARRRAGDHPRL